MSQKRKRTPSPAPEPSEERQYASSAAIEDRQSKFIGFFSPTLAYKALQGLPEIKSASHKVVGWRRESNQQSLTSTKRYVVGSDDDGEKYAGKKIEQVLEKANVVGCCVVARWWGGIMLGPARFEHIETVARAAITKWQEDVAETTAKKQRLEQDETNKQRLIKTLPARDQNIVVLRKLAMQKESDVQALLSTAENAEVRSTPPVTATPIEAPSYGSMPLDRLRILDKARDATIAFLLKRIDKAEADMKAATGVD